MTVTPSNSTLWSRIRPRIVLVGSRSTLPSTISYSSLPSRTAARARIANGKRRLRGFVARGLNRMIILFLPERYRRETAKARDGVLFLRARGEEPIAVRILADGFARKYPAAHRAPRDVRR